MMCDLCIFLVFMCEIASFPSGLTNVMALESGFGKKKSQFLHEGVLTAVVVYFFIFLQLHLHDYFSLKSLGLNSFVYINAM